MVIYMINSFKNFERLRYRLSNDMRKIAVESQENTDSLSGQIANTIFATLFSAFITEVAFRDSESGFDFPMIAKLCGVFIVVYIISYIIYNYIYKLIVKLWNGFRVHSVNTGIKKMIQIQKDFDNIACDSILIAREYQSAFDDLEMTNENKNLRIFYYYEILHYLDTACDKTEALVKNKSDCIRTMNEATGVDIFRVINIKNMMIELDQFLDDKCSIIGDDPSQNEAVNYQHAEVKRKINNINSNI